MKKILLLLAVILSYPFVAQEQPSFSELILETNRYLEIYDTVSPYGNNLYSFEELELPKSDKEELIQNSKDYSLVTNDSIENFDIIYFLQDRIIKQISEVVNHSDFGKNNIEELLLSDALGIVKSDDDLLYNFSIDEKSGGTYRSRISFMFYKDIGLIPNLESIIGRDSEALHLAFASNGYDSIFSIPTKEGTKYVLNGGVRVCSSCYASYISMIRYDGEQFISEFDYAVESRNFETGISYDSETMTIEVAYNTDDLTTYCYCDNEDSATHYPNGTPDYDREKTRACECKFKFNGVNFVLVEESSELIKQ